MAELTWLGVPAGSREWSQLGFLVDGETVRVGDVVIERAAGPVAWGFEALLDDPGVLGVPTRTSRRPQGPPSPHPNAVDRVDHVVYRVPDLDAAVLAIHRVLGLRPRRRAHPYGPDGPEMVFFRAGRPVLEVIDGADSPELWGLALRTADLDATVAAVRGAGGEVGDPKPAVQGGRIATARGTGLPLAFLERPAR
ncbi:MAG TPA: VOC family protein [Actinomycetota bacterium]|nr:VOC family protein [Actinomycetota bacterium]